MKKKKTTTNSDEERILNLSSDLVDYPGEVTPSVTSRAFSQRFMYRSGRSVITACLEKIS